MKLQKYIREVLIGIVLLLAWPVHGNAQIKAMRYPKVFNYPPAFRNEPYDNLGDTISMADARACIDAFEPAMREHAIINIAKKSSGKGARKDTTITTKLRMITTYETFGGKGFNEWLDGVIELLDSTGGENVGIKLAFGIYTEDFLQRRFPHEPKQIERRRDRITIFVIPYNKLTQRLIYTPEEGPNWPYVRKTPNVRRIRSGSSKFNSESFLMGAFLPPAELKAFELGGIHP